MVSRENVVIGACIALAVVAAYVIDAMVSLSTLWIMAILIAVGVVLPTLLNEILGDDADR